MKQSQFFLLILTIISSVFLSACQDTSITSPAGKSAGRTPPAVDARPDEEVLPTLQLKENGQDSKIVLRSQTSHFLNTQKSALEIDVTSSKVAYCENEHPALQAKEEEMIITLKAKNPKTSLDKGEFANSKDYEISAIRRNAAGQTTIPSESFQSLKITDLNAAIARGNFAISTPALTITGEYFTALCK